MGDLQRVGVFHFGDTNKRNPIRSLVNELNKESSENLKDCLIVLPEGFNVPGGYYSGSKPDPNLRKCLVSLSKQREIVWVAGLIEETVFPGYERGFNAAYLIDGKADSQVRLCCKRIDCRPEICSPHPDGCVNPISYRGLGIASLICNDFIDRRGTRVEDLLAHNGWSNNKTRVLCVPACAQIPGLLRERAEKFKEKVCILAANTEAENASVVLGNGCNNVLFNENEFLGINKLLYSELLC